MARWSKSQYALLRTKVRRKIAANMSPGHERAAVRKLLASLTKTSPSATSQLGIESYLSALALLESHARFGGLSEVQLKSVRHYAHGILMLSGIEAGRSPLSFAFGDFHKALADVARSAGDHRGALVELQNAWQLGRGETIEGKAALQLELAAAVLRLGDADGALGTLPDGAFAELALNARAVFTRREALRLAGRLAECSNLRPPEGLTKGRLADALAWQDALIAASQTGDWLGVVRLAQRGGALDRGRAQLEAWLVAAALPAKDAGKRLPAPSTILKKQERAVRDGQLGHVLLLLEQATHSSRPYSERFQLVTKAVGSAEHVDEIGTQLLVLAAARRWFLRNRAAAALAWTTALYQTLGRMLGGGVDPLNLPPYHSESPRGADDTEADPEWAA